MFNFSPAPHNNKHCVRKIEFKNLESGSFVLSFSRCLMSSRYINAAINMIWSLTCHNSRHINIEKFTTTCKTVLQKINSQIFTKWTNCVENCITGNVLRVWLMWRGKVQVLKSLVPWSMTHTRQSASVFGCGIFHFQNIFECTCVRYNIVLFAVFLILKFWV